MVNIDVDDTASWITFFSITKSKGSIYCKFYDHNYFAVTSNTAKRVGYYIISPEVQSNASTRV